MVNTRSNQPPGSGGASSGAGGASGGGSGEHTGGPGAPRSASADTPGGTGKMPLPPSEPELHQQYPHPPRPEPKPVQYYLTAPVAVYEFGKKRRKRKKYSRGLKTVQRTEDGLTLAGKRLGDAIESGFKSYRKRRNRSARKRKDGPIRDIFVNTGRGVSRFFTVGGDIPYDVTRKVNNKRFGKQVRDTVRFFTEPFGFN